jgi:ABC-type nitrate/sulfonate/bicarbonate transport system permease component
MKRAGLALWLPVALVVIWQILTSVQWLDPLFFPAPSTLVSVAWQMLRQGELTEQTLHTLGRMFIGFTAGSSAGLLCGLVMGSIPSVEASLEPLISAIYSTPNLTLLPLLMVFFGVGNTAGIILIATGCFILVATHALDAVRRVNHAYVEVAANYGANRVAILRKVYIPACLPGIFTGMRLAVGRALIIAVSVELVSPRDGLGSMIWLAWQTLSTERLYVGVLTTALLGLLFNIALRGLETRLIPWGRQT